MKRVQRRAAAALLLALLLAAGMGIYIYRYVTEGAQWTLSTVNQQLYDEGELTLTAVITDRNGTVLADLSGDTHSYAEDAETRVACVHAVGDYEGNIGTGALTAFAERLSGYSLVSGLAENVTLTLTIDAALQRTAVQAMAGRAGAVLVSNYETGEILCMVSTPGYDPETGIDADDASYEGAYINRAISAAYTPGSVFKLITAAAAIETLADYDTRTYTCTGSTDIAGVTVNCTGVHGTQTFAQALANSCNCAFAEISLALGPETLADYADRLGFTSSHQINGIDTRRGQFEQAARGSASLAWSGIGQYTDLVCPYAMLRYVAAIANGGVCVEGTLIVGETGSQSALLSPDTADALAALMRNNVVSAYGDSRFGGLTLCAKTGTAERGDGTSNSWFTGFLQDPDHPYAFCVVIEGGGSGLSNAGAVAASVLLEAAAG